MAETLWGSLSSCGRLSIGPTQRVPPRSQRTGGGKQPPRRLPTCPTWMVRIVCITVMFSASAADGPGAPRFPSPIELAVSKDGARLYALCEGTDEVVAYDARSAKIVRRIKVGRVPKGLALSPDGTRLYVANSWSDSVSEIDTASLVVVRSLPAGFEPNAVLTDLPGRFLYVANRVSNDVSVVDLAAGAAPATWRFLPLAPESIAPTSTPMWGNSARRRNRRSRSSTPRGRRSRTTIACPMRRESSTWRCRPTGVWEWRRNCVPRT